MRYPNTPEARRTSPGASQGPLRPREDREPPETAVRRPEMPRENAGAPPVSTDTRSGQSVTEASQMAKTTVPAGSKNVSATEKAAVAPPTQRAARTHQDLAAARAERKQAQAGRAASAGSIRYDRQTAPEEARGVDRPDIARVDEATDTSRKAVKADTENNVKKEEKTT